MKRLFDDTTILLGIAAIASWTRSAAEQHRSNSGNAGTTGSAGSSPIVGIGNFRPVCADSSSSSSSSSSASSEADDDEMQSACMVSQFIIEAMEQDDLLNGKIKSNVTSLVLDIRTFCWHTHWPLRLVVLDPGRLHHPC